MKKYKIWPLVKARWGKRDARWCLGLSVVMGLILCFTHKVTINGIALTGLSHVLSLLTVGFAYWGILYLVYFLLTILVYSIITKGANIQHPGYVQLYTDYLKGK